MDISPQKFICQTPQVKSVPKQIINGFLQKYVMLRKDTNDIGPLFLLTASLEPCTVGPWVRISRVRMAYGDKAIPKLKRGLSSSNVTLVQQSLSTLCDVLNDPEMASIAMEKNVMARLAPLMVHQNETIRLKTCSTIRVLAVQAKGRCRLVDNDYLLENLKKCFVDSSPSVRVKSSCTMLALAENYFAVPKLIKARFIPYIIDVLLYEQLQITAIVNHLTSLELLLDLGYDARVEAIAFNALDLAPLLDHEEDYVATAAAALFTQLFQIKIGKVAALEHNIIPILCRGLYREGMSVKSKMAKALSFATILSEGRKKALSEGILPVLQEYALSHQSTPELRLFCLKVLSNVSELPDARLLLRRNLGTLKKTPIQNASVERTLNGLIESILWEP